MAEREDEGLHGEKGGAAEAAGVRYAARPETTEGWWLKDRIRWGPVWAGTLIAIACQLVLTMLGVAIGLSNARAAVTAPGAISSGVGIWTAIAALISLFIGGFVAARLAGVAGTWNGIWHGVVVWALALALGTIALSFGISGILGITSNVAGVVGRTGAIPTGPGAAVTPAEAARAARAVSTGAWWFLLGAILALLAAAGGGALGSRPEAVVGEQPAERAA